MKIIDKIEIKHFRSFMGSTKEYEAAIYDLKDLNIFSGANDSGKSNILRALNLFFNDEISPNNKFNFERDFFIGKKDKTQKIIEISLTFILDKKESQDFLPERFKVSKIYNREGYRNHLFTFQLKNKPGKVIRIDSRAEENSEVYKEFLPENFNSLPEEKKQEKVNSAQKKEARYRAKFNGFLKSTVSYEYIPAIRDSYYFSNLCGRVILQIKQNEDDQIDKLIKEKNKIIRYDKTLKNKSENKDFLKHLMNESWRKNRLEELDKLLKKQNKISKKIEALEKEINLYSKGLIKSLDFLDSEFKVGKNLQEFFEDFDIGTGASKSISFKLRGDGIQAKYIPKMLNFLSQIGTSKYYIWGFEEPENSAEYKNQKILAAELKNNFSNQKQIFITSHSEEFLSLYDDNTIEKKSRKVNLYHVKKMNSKEYGYYSKIFIFDVDKNEFEFANQKAKIDEDLGIPYLRAKYSKEYKEKIDSLDKELKIKDQDANKLKKQLERLNKPILFVEDKYDQIYKIAWLKINNISNITTTNIDSLFEENASFIINKCEGATCLQGFLNAKNIEYWSDKKVIGLFDFDEEGAKIFKNLKDNGWNKDELLGELRTGFYKKRNDSNCFFALLLPIPERLENTVNYNDTKAFVEIENLLSTDFLINNNFVTEKPYFGIKYYEFKDAKKSSLWKKLLNLSEEHFEDFKPLFETIGNLFG